MDLIDLLRFPGILREDNTDTETLMQTVRSLFGETLTELARARVREGERLAALISQRCAARVSQSCFSAPSWGLMNSGLSGTTWLCPGATSVAPSMA